MHKTARVSLSYQVPDGTNDRTREEVELRPGAKTNAIFTNFRVNSSEKATESEHGRTSEIEAHEEVRRDQGNLQSRNQTLERISGNNFEVI